MSAASSVVITGAGSGVGRATALYFAERGWRTALVGRTEASLEETAALYPGGASVPLIQVCDLGNAAGVETMAQAVLKAFGTVEAVVNAAGHNIPVRSLSKVSIADYQAVLDANLHGVLYIVKAFLPAMREKGRGTFVNINSDAGRQASPKAGCAYVVSKFGLSGLTQTINAEERANGIRATSIFPGDIDTPLLKKRPVEPSPEAKKLMLQSEDLAACAYFAATLPERAIIEELLVRPAKSLHLP